MHELMSDEERVCMKYSIFRKMQCILHHKHLQEIHGWCEENSYDRLRKALTLAIKRQAAEAGTIGSDNL